MMDSKTPAYDGITVPPLDKVFRAESVAIVGASPKPGARNRIVKVLIQHGFEGRIYPVSPSADEVEGHKAYKTLADLPEVPDVALIITPAATVPGLIAECGQKGITCAIVYSAGFEEIESGKELALELKAAAEKHGVHVLGPNGQGVWSVQAKTMLTFGAAAFGLRDLRHAPIAIVSQSGALMGAIGAHLQRSGLGCSYIVSVGNETCMDALDALSWVVEQDDVRVVGLYLEGLNDAARLLPIAARARARGIQIVVLKAGRSAFGQEATASHTGKIASPHAIYTDVLEQAGVIMVESLGEAMAAVEALSYMPDPRVSGDPLGGIAVLSSSGGAGALLADHSDERGLPMCTFSDATMARLEETLPEFARKANPVDLTGQIRQYPNLFRDTLAVLAAESRTEAIVIQFASSGMKDLIDNGEAFKQAAKDSGLPIVITFAMEKVSPEIRAEFAEAGILISDDPSNTMRALRWLYDRRRYAELEVAPPVVGDAVDVPQSWGGMMDYLEEAGVTPANWTLVQPGQSAAEACAGLNWPVVVKVLPDAAEHKTELGLVKLKLQTPEEVDAHAAEFRRILGQPDMPVLVQEMVTDGVEVVLSCLGNTDFGPVLSIGSGGVAIELYRDVTYLALPVTPAQVEASLRKLKLWHMLEGFRGAPKADIAALVDAAVGFGNMILRTRNLAEAEINPVLVRPEGQGLVAVDFLGTARDAH
ncbi:acetate--CoA ligase family protein [Mangrovicoccus ximenensis]|uniref:acetate--CoA ligase family protein n=1 Tax=Mangrovicoccus ximenensis TaxID=1911570 RepID=UPI001F242C62|nr:acetate--CoA ligase family protein [Mangrovicoccus ximenensis]